MPRAAPSAAYAKPAPAPASRAAPPKPNDAYPHPTVDYAGQLHQQIVTMMTSKAAKELFLTQPYTKPKIGENAHATNLVVGRLGYDIRDMGRRRAHDASPLIPAVPLPDSAILAAAASAPVRANNQLYGFGPYFSSS